MSQNIDGIIKSVLYSDRPLNHKNIKFNTLKQILLSDKVNEVFYKKNVDMKKLLLYYQEQIEKDKSLKSFEEYISIIEDIQQKRLNIVLNGNKEKIVYNRLKQMQIDEEMEKYKKNRGYRNFKLTNGSIPIKITVLDELEYEIKIMQLDIIYNITTSYEIIKSTELNNWFESIKKYGKEFFNTKPIVSKGTIFIGENDYKKETILLYHCLTNDKIYCVKRVQLKI